MTLKGLRDLCAFSREEEWHVIECGRGGDGERADPRPDGHRWRATYRPNVSVSMAWGQRAEPDEEHEWPEGLDAPGAELSVVDFYFNGALVDRERYLVVDDGSAYLPLPRREDDRFVITPWQDAFFRFLDGLDKDSQFDAYKGRAGIEVELLRD